MFRRSADVYGAIAVPYSNVTTEADRFLFPPEIFDSNINLRHRRKYKYTDNNNGIGV